MKNETGWRLREKQASTGVIERFKYSKVKRRLLGYAAGIALALGAGGLETQTANADGVHKAEKNDYP